MVFITGKSGSGKSTLLYLLAGLLKPSEGRVSFNGKSLKSFTQKSLSSFRNNNIGFLFQSYCLLEGLSVIENIMLPARINGKKPGFCKQKARKLLDKYGIRHLEKRKVDFLSGGEKQRVALCRSLINNPDVILCDEPTGALDKENGDTVMDSLYELSKERLVIVVTHNLNYPRLYPCSSLEIPSGVYKSKNANDNLGSKKKRAISSGNKKGWRTRLALAQIKRNRAGSIMLLASSLICYLASCLSISLFCNSKSAIKEKETASLSFMQARIYEEELVSLGNSPLTLIREKRPLLEEAKKATAGVACDIGIDISCILPLSNKISIGPNEIESSLIPVSDWALSNYQDSLILSGRGISTPSNECLINRAFQDDSGASIGDNVQFNVDKKVSYNGATDLFSLDLSLDIVGVVDDFSFMASPQLYFGYEASKTLISTIGLPNISEAVGEEINLLTLMEEAPPSSFLSSYGYFVFPKSNEDAYKLYQKKESGNIKIGSSYYSSISAFDSLASAIGGCLAIFLAISSVTTCIIVSVLTYSSYSLERKRSGILIALGASKNDVFAIFSIGPIAISCMSFLVSLLLSAAITPILNMLGSSILGFPFLFGKGVSALQSIICLGAFALSLLMPFFAAFFPIFSANPLNVSKEIKDL